MKLYRPDSKFTTEEFACKCGCGLGSQQEDISRDLIDKLDMVRMMYGKPMIVESGARCQEHNAKSGGEPDSAHLPHTETHQCRAVDIRVSGGVERFELVRLALKVGFKRIGVAKTFVHLDVAWDLPSPVLFVY